MEQGEIKRLMASFVADQGEQLDEVKLLQALNDDPELKHELAAQLQTERLMRLSLNPSSEQDFTNGVMARVCKSENRKLMASYLEDQEVCTDEAKLLDALKDDPELKQELASQVQTERLMRLALSSSSEQHFADEVLERLRMKDDGKEFTSQVMARLRAEQSQPIEPQAILPQGRPQSRISRLPVPGKKNKKKSRAKKPILLWYIAAAAVLSLAAVFALRPPSGSTSGAAEVAVQVGGGVRVERDGKVIALEKGMQLMPGDRVTSAGASSAKLFVNAGRGTITLNRDAEIVWGDSKAELTKGTLDCAFKPKSFETPFAIDTPHAQIAVTGTAFRLDARDGDTMVNVSEGQVIIKSEAGEEVANAGDIVSASPSSIARWQEVCNLDFGKIRELPKEMTCFTALHRKDGEVVSEMEKTPERARLENGFLVVDGFTDERNNGLTYLYWDADTGRDILIEVDFPHQDLLHPGVTFNGSTDNGYRVTAVNGGAKNFWSGMQLDTLYGNSPQLIEHNSKIISDTGKYHKLRIERRGNRIRAWINNELRIDQLMPHELADPEGKGFALMGLMQRIRYRSLRVWHTPDE